MARRRPRDAYSETWEWWRKALAVLSLIVWLPLTFWIGIPVGASLTISTAGLITAWRSLYATGDPRLGSYMQETPVYKVAAFITRAKSVATQYWETFKQSKATFFALFTRSIGGGMPFPDPWHLTSEEQKEFEQSQANAPASIKDYSSRFTWRSMIPMRLSTIWSSIFALIVAALEIPVTMLTDMTVSWGFSLPIFISYPLSALFLFFLAQFYCITRLTQGNWGEVKALVPAPTLMLNRMKKEHWKPGLFTSSIVAIVTLVVVASFVVGIGIPLVPSLAVAVSISVLVAAVTISVRAMKPWRAPWNEYIEETHLWSNAFRDAVGEEYMPSFVSTSPFPSDSEMMEIIDMWRARRDAGELADEEAEEAPSSTNKLSVFLYNNTGLSPDDLFGQEDGIENRIPHVNNLAFIFPERNDREDEPIPGTVSDEGFQALYSTEHKDFTLRKLVERKYPLWDEELAIHNTVIRDVAAFFKTHVQLVDTIWHTEEDSPSHVLEIIVHPLDDRFDLVDFAKFADRIESTREIKWIRARLSNSADSRNNISILMSGNPHDERIKFATNGLTASRMIQDADWSHVFRKSGVISSDGTLPEYKFSKKSTELVTTTSFMLPTELDRGDVKYMADEFKKLTSNDFIEVKGGWDYAKTANEATKKRAKNAKAFSILSAPKDPLDQAFLFGDYADVSLLGRKKDYEQIDWVAGINSADQPAFDSFLKGDAPHLLIAGESGSGKPMHPDTKVWVYGKGATAISNLSSGEFILSSEGRFVRVKNVFATRPEAESYLVSHKHSKHEVMAAGKHLWSTRYEFDSTYGTQEDSVIDYHGLDNLEVSGDASQMLREGIGDALVGEPLNLSGRLPVPLNFRYPLGVSEASPEATNARSVAAMRGVAPHLTAVLTVFAKNERPDGHIIVNNPDAAYTLFATAGYRIRTIEKLESGAHHMWCEDIYPLLSQIDFDNCDYPFFATSMAAIDIMLMDADKARRECAAALINCFVPCGFDVNDSAFFAGTVETARSTSADAEFFARLALMAFGARNNGKSPVTLADDVSGRLAVHSSAIKTAREMLGYESLREFARVQHSSATGALAMMHKLDELVYVLPHTELVYFLLSCGISVNTHEENSGLLFIESADTLRRRDVFLPRFDDDDNLILDDELDYSLVLIGMIIAIGQVHIEDTEQVSGQQTVITLHCSADRAKLLLDTSARCSQQHDTDEMVIRPGKQAGQYIVSDEMYERIAAGGIFTGNMNPAVGMDGTLVHYRDAQTLEPLVDRHAIVRMTGLSYQQLSTLLVNVKPVARTRTGYDMISPTGRGQVHLVHAARELYAHSDIVALLHDAESHSGQHRTVVAEPVLTTFSLAATHGIMVPRLVDSNGDVPAPVEFDAADDITMDWTYVDAEAYGEENEMMCITVDDDTHTFMLADNGLMTHNSVFVQSMLTQLAYNNGPSEVLMWLLDPKIGLQRFMYLDSTEKFLDPWTPDTDFFANCADFFADGVDRMANERNAKLAKTPDPETGIPPEKLGEAREAARRESEQDGTNPRDHELMFPYIFMVIEECATVFADAGSKEEAAYQADVLRHAGRIAREGRSAGVYEICMTQYPTNASIPSQIRNQMRRVGLKCRNSFASNIIIDQDGLEELYLPGSAMTRDDNGEYRKCRGFLLRNGKPSLGEENDLMEVLGSLPKNTTSQAGLSTNVSGVQQVSFGDDLIVDMELLYDDVWINKMTYTENHVNADFEKSVASKLDESIIAGKKTKSKIDSEADLNREMKKAGEKNSAPWLKFDDTGKPVSSAKYESRASEPAVPAATGRRASGRKSRLKK